MCVWCCCYCYCYSRVVLIVVDRRCLTVYFVSVRDPNIQCAMRSLRKFGGIIYQYYWYLVLLSDIVNELIHKKCQHLAVMCVWRVAWLTHDDNKTTTTTNNNSDAFLLRCEWRPNTFIPISLVEIISTVYRHSSRDILYDVMFPIVPLPGQHHDHHHRLVFDSWCSIESSSQHILSSQQSYCLE